MLSQITGGGEMIADVFLDHSTYAEPPSRSVSLLLLSAYLGRPITLLSCNFSSVSTGPYSFLLVFNKIFLSLSLVRLPSIYYLT